MRYFKTFILLLLTQLTWAQDDYKQINFGLINYALTDEVMRQQVLENILNTMSAFGDNEIVLEEIFKTLLISEDRTKASQQIDTYINDFTSLERNRLCMLPNLGEDCIENAYNLVYYCYFGRALLRNTSLIETYTTVGSENAKFPHLPGSGAYTDPILDGVYSYYNFSNWALNYPNEVIHFKNLFLAQTKAFYGSNSNDDVVKFAKHLKKKFTEENSIYMHHLPIPLAKLLKENKSKGQRLKYSELCNRNDIDQFLYKSYELIFNIKPSSQTIQSLKQYIASKNIYKPELIYLALILDKYE